MKDASLNSCICLSKFFSQFLPLYETSNLLNPNKWNEKQVSAKMQTSLVGSVGTGCTTKKKYFIYVKVTLCVKCSWFSHYCTIIFIQLEYCIFENQLICDWYLIAEKSQMISSDSITDFYIAQQLSGSSYMCEMCFSTCMDLFSEFGILGSSSVYTFKYIL